jgi:SAM-dependent methyltransferase
MSAPRIAKQMGRQLFGLDPAAYHRSRPDYPEWVYQTLCSRCGLGPGTATFEIGAGTGIVTRRLRELGARPLIAIEPDPRLAEFLRRNNPDPVLNVVVSAFEDAVLEHSAFDLGVSATAFHWLEEDAALAKIALLLRPGGWWAAFWNVFRDDSRPDPFHEATKDILDEPASPSADGSDIPFALDFEMRLAALRRSGAFDIVDSRISTWTLTLDTDQAVALYATYSNINVRSDRDAVLAELGRVAHDKFGGRVVRNMTTSLYIARRSS